MASLVGDALDTSTESNNTPSQERRGSGVSSLCLTSPISVDQNLPTNHSSAFNDDNNTNQKKREVYRYQADWLVSSLACSNEPGESFRLALASYIEDYSNRVELVSLTKDDCDEQIVSLTSFEHPYPATKVLWIPKIDQHVYLPQLIATTADYLRLWRVIDVPCDNSIPTSQRNYSSSSAALFDETDSKEKVEVKLECLLSTNQGLNYCAPLTSFDWNDIDPRIIVTSSVDTTCAIWDIEASNLINSVKGDKINCKLRSQIVAHNHEVYDVAFSRSGSGSDVFVSAGGDGSLRLFDLRNLATSTMLYETERDTTGRRKDLVRVACNKQDANYVSAFATDSKDLIIIDLRQPRQPVVVLGSHTAHLNGMSWAPHSVHHICSASSDCQALIWELSKLPNNIEEPLLAYRASGKINAISWFAAHPDWIAIGFENCLELLRV